MSKKQLKELRNIISEVKERLGDNVSENPEMDRIIKRWVNQ